MSHVFTGIDNTELAWPVIGIEGNTLVIKCSPEGQNSVKMFSAEGMPLSEGTFAGEARFDLRSHGKGLRIISINGRHTLKLMVR